MSGKETVENVSEQSDNLRNTKNFTEEQEKLYDQGGVKQDTEEFIKKANEGDVTVDDCLKMKADTSNMRKLKTGQENELVEELGEGAVKEGQEKFQKTMQEKVYDPSYNEAKEKFFDKLEKRTVNGEEFGVVKIDGEEHFIRVEDVKIDTVRTAGTNPNSINTDNDIVMKLELSNGKAVEVPSGKWEDDYFDAYSKNTGIMKNGEFDIAKAKEKFPDADWSSNDVSKLQRQWGGELHGETPTDLLNKEASYAFSDQHHMLAGNKSLKFDEMFPDGNIDYRIAQREYPQTNWENMTQAEARLEWDKRVSNYYQTTQGEAALVEAQQFANMEMLKVRQLWNTGTLVNQKEAVEQLSKACKSLDSITEGYRIRLGDGNLPKNFDIPLSMQKGMEIVKGNGTLAFKQAELKKCGYLGIEDFTEKLTGRFEGFKLFN